MAQIAAEKCAVDIYVGIEVEIAFVDDIGVGLVVHQRQQFLAVAAYHTAIAPRQCGAEQCRDFYVGKRAEAARELNGIVGDERLGVDSARFAVEQLAKVKRIGHQRPP